MGDIREKYKVEDQSVYTLQAEDKQRMKEIEEKQRECRSRKTSEDLRKEVARKAREKTGISCSNEDGIER